MILLYTILQQIYIFEYFDLWFYVFVPFNKWLNIKVIYIIKPKFKSMHFDYKYIGLLL